MIADFHFLRPEWFYALVPAILLFVVLKARNARSSNWERTIDPALLPYLLDNPGAKMGGSPFVLLLIAWVLAIIALAGPVWQKLPQPVHEREDALVIVFDLTRSMYAEDVKPNRLVRAQRKLQDLLNQRREGVTALVVFAGDAHTVSPLTDDAETIREMIPAISPAIMPASGSRLAPALELSVNLFKDAGVASGRILIITDEVRDLADSQAIARQYRHAYPISVLSVGTAEGAPIPAANFTEAGGFLKDQNGVLVIPKVDFASLQTFADLAGGRFSQMTLADEDLEYLLAPEQIGADDVFRTLERDFDTWVEQGPWLLLLLLPLAALGFRRGWLWLLPLAFLVPSEPVYASWWDDLWQTRNEQAITALERGDAETAARLFEDEAWRGTAHYRAEDYENAANQFGGIESSDGRYNLGNALARAGKYAEAIEAYDRALAMNPNNEDAAFNKELIEKLLENQQSGQQDQQDGDGQQQQSEQQDQQEGESDQQGDQQQAGNEPQDQETEEQQEQETEDQQQADEGEDQQQGEQQMAQEDAQPLNDEERQALEQWLRRVPDDPGGLLRRKFELQHAERQRSGGATRRDQADW